MIFAAIDFETCHTERDSACAVAVVRVEDGAVAERFTTLLSPPPRLEWQFERVHGLARADVAAAPRLRDAWAALADAVGRAAFVAAHHAVFDRGVLEATCRAQRIPRPAWRWRCTRDLARTTWPTLTAFGLEDVCRHLGIPLERHHDPLCDAEACARIVLAAQRRSVGSRP